MTATATPVKAVTVRRRRRAPVLTAALVLVAAGLSVAAVAGRHRATAHGTVPVVGAATVVERDDVGDPFILPVAHGVPGDATARYVLFWTTDWRSNVPTAVSADLVHWHRVADSLPVLPSWAARSATMTWGPTAVAVAGGYALFYSTQEASTGLECLGRAYATSATGPYVDRSASPLVCQRSLGGDIDPAVTRTATGLALVWKNDGNARNAPVSLWEQALDADGVALQGGVHRLLGVDAAWEDGIIEGPALLADPAGGWWLFFSGGAWQSDTYDTGVAWCATVAGPCHDAAKGPVLSSRPGAVSPGGLDTFTDSAGRLWASYSAFPSQPANREAAMAEDRVLEIAPVLRR